MRDIFIFRLYMVLFHLSPKTVMSVMMVMMVMMIENHVFLIFLIQLHQQNLLDLCYEGISILSSKL